MPPRPKPVSPAKAPRRPRRTTPAAASVTRRRATGNPGYRGYDYQIDVTIWVALELMLAKGSSTRIIIEPPDHEDIKAAVQDPDRASLKLDTGLPDMNLSVQAKSRSTAPWSATAFADILLGKDPASPAAGAGPAKRVRPLDMLVTDPTAYYLFVTNEALDASLRPYQNVELLNFPDPGLLPPHCRKGRSPVQQKPLARRIGICDGVTPELLEARIFKLLDTQGNIAPQKHAGCLKDLRIAVRERLAGESGGCWTAAELLATIVAHGGSRLAHRRHDQFVPPRSYAEIERALYERDVVIIVGPSGTGKSLTADVLAAGLERQSPPFLERKVVDAGDVRSAMSEHGPLYFHLRDPWGDSRPSDEADRWSSALPALLRMAGPGRKFLVTSRSDIFLRSEPSEALKDYSVAIEPEDYSDAQRAQIYDNHVTEMSGQGHDLALHHRDAALPRLERPYEIERFLATLTREKPDQPRALHAILAQSGIEAISSVIRDQALGWGDDGLACAAILWGLLATAGSFDIRDLRKLMRRLRADHALKPHVEGFIDFMATGRNLRIDGDVVRIQHPRVLEGLGLALATNRAEIEALLTDLADSLISLGEGTDVWATRTAVEILRTAPQLDHVDIILGAAARAQLDRGLAARAAAPSSGSIERAFADLSRFAMAGFAPRRFAEMLLRVPPREPDGWPVQTWVPPDLTAEEVEGLRRDPHTPSLLCNFIRGGLPFMEVDYEADFLAFAAGLADDLGPAFGDAVTTLAALQGVGHNIETIVTGAVGPGGPGYDAVIQAFVAGEAAVDRWFEEYAPEMNRAREHEVDAVHADHILEQPGERYYTVDAGLKAAARRRYAAEGWGWLNGHPHAAILVYALASEQINSREDFTPLYLKTLLAHADSRALPSVWSLIERHWDPALRPDLESALLRVDLDDKSLRTTLAEIAILASPPDGTDLFRAILPRMPVSRRLEFALDLGRIRGPKGPGAPPVVMVPARAFVDLLASTEYEIAEALLAVDGRTDVGQLFAGLSRAARQRIVDLIPQSSDGLAGLLLFLAAPGPADILMGARRLLATGDLDDAMPAIVALRIRDGAGERALLRESLCHRRYRARRAAMEHLISAATVADRPGLIEMARDPGADVRRRWADLMHREKWPEAEAALAILVGDDRDFSIDRHHGLQAGWARHSVARAAARALGAYQNLGTASIDALLTASRAEDPFVRCAALRALAEHDDPRIPPLLRAALRDSGINGDPEHRPVAQAAAWAYFDRAISRLTFEAADFEALRSAALTEPGWIAGPALIALGIRAGDAREEIIAALAAEGRAERIELLQVAAAVDRKPVGDHPLLSAMTARLEALEGPLPEPTDAALTAWGLALGQRDVAGLTSWVAAKCLKVDIPDVPDDPCIYRVPSMMPMLTMYSMSPDREEDGGPDEGY
ncbi:MAG: hypothetical protein JWR80_6025 [Bradyrhizobium sp.]|nr:hypothetical protein [Bradyrhizobium sp.]